MCPASHGGGGVKLLHFANPCSYNPLSKDYFSSARRSYPVIAASGQGLSMRGGTYFFTAAEYLRTLATSASFKSCLNRIRVTLAISRKELLAFHSTRPTSGRIRHLKARSSIHFDIGPRSLAALAGLRAIGADASASPTFSRSSAKLKNDGTLRDMALRRLISSSIFFFAT